MKKNSYKEDIASVMIKTDEWHIVNNFIMFVFKKFLKCSGTYDYFIKEGNFIEPMIAIKKLNWKTVKIITRNSDSYISNSFKEAFYSQLLLLLLNTEMVRFDSFNSCYYTSK